MGRIADFSVSDETVVFTVKDLRVGSYAQIPVDHYWEDNYPDMDINSEGLPIPLFRRSVFIFATWVPEPPAHFSEVSHFWSAYSL